MLDQGDGHYIELQMSADFALSNVVVLLKIYRYRNGDYLEDCVSERHIERSQWTVVTVIECKNEISIQRRELLNTRPGL